MTIEEFDNTRWSGGMKCIYQGKEHKIGAGEFEEKLVGLCVDYSDQLAWVRCENIELIADQKNMLTEHSEAKIFN